MAEVKEQPVPVSEPIYEQPTAQPVPSYKVVTGSEEWKNDIFSCMDGGLEANDHLCLKTTFCPCFTYGKQQERLRNPTLQGYERINNDCIMWAGAQYVCGLSWILTMMKRGEIREKYDIKGDQMSDCLMSWCCGCCALIQQEKEIIARQESAGQSVGYAKTPGMTA